MSLRPKFLFDVDFGGGEAGEKARRTVSQAAHEVAVGEAREIGYREGFAVAQANAAADAARSATAALERAAVGLAGLAPLLRGLEARLEAATIEIAVAVARKLALALIDREPLSEIAALAADCFRHLTAAPHVVLRVNDAIYPEARESLAVLARANGFEGRLVVLAEPEILPGDCRIEWADGGMVRDRAATAAAIEEVINRYLAARGVGPRPDWRAEP